MNQLADKLYAIADKGPLRALSLILAILLMGCIFKYPSRFASSTSDLSVWHSFVFMWAICTGIIHGVGFKPIKSRWKGLFSPLPAMIVMLAGLYYFFS